MRKQDMINPKFRYGVWAGNPNGVLQNKTKCVWPIWGDYRTRQCSRNRKTGLHGLFCKQHAKAYEESYPFLKYNIYITRDEIDEGNHSYQGCLWNQDPTDALYEAADLFNDTYCQKAGKAGDNLTFYILLKKEMYGNEEETFCAGGKMYVDILEDTIERTFEKRF